MFRRRTPQSLAQRSLNALWPRLGWARYAAYLRLRLSRLAGTPHSIAIGFACGVAIAPTPLMGAHLLGAALLAILLRGNVIASAIGGFVGNPWTYPLIWVGTLEIGRLLVPASLWDVASEKVNFIALFSDLTRAIIEWDVTTMGEKVLPVWSLMMIGSIPVGAAMALAAYWAVRRTMERVNQAREVRRRRRRAQVAAGALEGSQPSTAG